MSIIHANLIFILYWFLVLAMAISVVLLVISVAKRKDERKIHIMDKAMANAFAVSWGLLLVNVLWTTIRIITGQGGSPYPFVYLFVMTLIFLISLLFNNRKYGD